MASQINCLNKQYSSDTASDEAMALLFLTLIKKTSLIPRPLPRAHKLPSATRKPRHSQETVPELSRIQQNWLNEGESPKFEDPSEDNELQIWHRDKLYRFHGKNAMIRLQYAAPSVFATFLEGRKEPVGLYTVDTRLCLYLTGSTLARSFMGATGNLESQKILGDRIVSESFTPVRSFSGYIKHRRFYDCITKVFRLFKLYSRKFKELAFLRLGNALIRDMFNHGRCESPLVKFVLNSLNCILQDPKNPFEEWICSFPQEQRAILWKLRRIFSKDDNDPLKVAKAAIDRMCIPVLFTSEQLLIREEILQKFEEYASSYVEANFLRLKQKHDCASLHRSAATTFCSRSSGGGGAEVALIVGLFRLQRNIPSPLSDVFGQISRDTSMAEMVGMLKAESQIREEIMAACFWFNKELDKRKISFPYLCIYPEREPKARSFMMLPYSLQLGGYMASTIFSDFLRNQTDTREVFRGFKTGNLLHNIKRDIDEGAEMILSLDSAVATDQLPHDLCKRLYKPFYPIFSEYTKDCIERIFSPTRVHLAGRRPRPFMEELAFDLKLTGSIPIPTIKELYEPPLKKAPEFGINFRAASARVPTFIRTYNKCKYIARALFDYGRVILKSPTGSGKTIMAATMFNAIIQFPSIATMLLFSETLKSINAPHNLWYSGSKDITEYDSDAGEPRTILCTAYFIPILACQYPGMIIVLDEAETKRDYFIYNLFWTKYENRRTLIMSATPEELRQEQDTFRIVLDGGTNFPVEKRTCTESDMLKRLELKCTPQSLVCTFSEPSANKIGNHLRQRGKKVLVLDQKRRQEDFTEEIRNAEVIVATNVVRSSVTLPDLVEVYDFCRSYESVDFPLAGIQSLILMEASPAMKTQLLGRVGRMQPGIYWEIVGHKRHAEPYSPILLERSQLMAEQLGHVPLEQFARRCNQGSLFIERFFLNVCDHIQYTLPITIRRDRPLWASIMTSSTDSARVTIFQIVAFEQVGIASRLQTFRDDEFFNRYYEEFTRVTADSYESTVRRVLSKLKQLGMFKTELGQIERWSKDLEEDTQELLYTTQNYKAMSLALWRNICVSDGTLLTGTFRDFAVKIPVSFPIKKGNYAIAVGVSLQERQLIARSAISIPFEIFDWLKELLYSPNIEPVFIDREIGSIPILGFSQLNVRKGNQDKNVHLHWDKFASGHLFKRSDSERIWEAMKDSLENSRESDDQMTVQGSPMSGTASFAMLNGLGFAVHHWVRNQTQEALYSASIFGDDDFVVGSTKACLLDQKGREACGLKTKEEATGRILLKNEDGSRKSDLRSLALFTERLIDPNRITIVEAVKPAGLYRLYLAYHNEKNFNFDEVFLSDMSDYDRQISGDDAYLHSLITENASGVKRAAARRTTAPRSIVQKLLSKTLGPHDKIALGPDVERLIDNLESTLLLFYPSTKGLPDRVEEPISLVYGHPVISLEEAKYMAEILQGEDCYFKLKGRPLSFNEGPLAVQAGQKEMIHRNLNPFQLSHPREILRTLGWGNPNKEVTHAAYSPILDFEQEEPPIEYDYILDGTI